MNAMDILEMAFKYGGPFAALTFALIYYMRKDHRKDYEGVTKRLNQVEDYQKEKLADVLADNTRAISENSRIISENSRAMSEVQAVILQCKRSA